MSMQRDKSRGFAINADCFSGSMCVAIQIEAVIEQAVILSVLHLLFT